MSKTVNSEIVKIGELHSFSLRIAYSKIPITVLKQLAQSMREDIDWRGRSSYNHECYDAMMYVIHIGDPNFKTEFIPV